MQTERTPHQAILDRSCIWPLAKKRDFSAIITQLSQEGIGDDDVGETLFALSKQALSAGEPAAAKAILFFLIEALEDQAEAPPILKALGNIYSLEKNHEKAREFYGKLPLTLQSIELCFATYIPNHDIDGLLSLRDTIVERIPPNAVLQVHQLTDNCIQKIANSSQITTKQNKRYQQNIKHLAKLSPFSSTPKTLKQLQAQKHNQARQTSLFATSGTTYEQKNGIWNKTKSTYATQETIRKSLQGGENLIIRAASPENFLCLVNALFTDNPAFIKYECWIVIDFKLLEQILCIYDISSLLNCNYVIRFINEPFVDGEITNLIQTQHLLFPNRTFFLHPEDHNFYSHIIKPTISKCEQKMEEDIQHYKKQLTEIFKDDYYEKVLGKIQEGKQLRILFQTSKFTSYLQYSSRDMAEGFHQLGHDTFIEIEEKDAGVGIRKDICLKNLINFRPDIIFNINHFRYEYPWIPKIIPYVTWVQDLMPHIQNIREDKTITSKDHILSFSKKWITTFFKTNMVFKNKKIQLSPVISDQKTFYHLPQCQKKYDITYVTHINDPHLTYLPISNGIFPEDIKTTKEKEFAYELLNEIEGSSISKLNKLFWDNEARQQLAFKICDKINIQWDNSLQPLIDINDSNKGRSRLWHHLILRIKSAPILHLINNGLKVKVFGNNWEKLPEFSETAMGSVENGSALNTLYNQSRINLNISPGTSYHMKAPEVIASKNFMLSLKIDRHYDNMPIDDLFSINDEVILFDNEKDLLNKAIHFLGHRDERELISKKAHRKLQSFYSNRHACELILQNIIAS